MICLLAAISLFFSPNGGCEEAIVKQIKSAKTSVWIEAYSFTSKPIIQAVLDAHARKVDIQVILDKSWQTESPNAEAQLVAAGVPVLIDSKHAIAHAKIIIIDGQKAFLGSYNFTGQASHSNHEILALVTGGKAVKEIIADYQVHSAHSLAP